MGKMSEKNKERWRILRIEQMVNTSLGSLLSMSPFAAPSSFICILPGEKKKWSMGTYQLGNKQE
jgi:hypothetical protein